MALVNIQMKKYNGSTWDTLYPTTTWDRVLNHPDIPQVPADIGAVPTSGGTMTGNLTLHDGGSNSAQIILDITKNGATQVRMSDHDGDTQWSYGIDDGDNNFKIHSGSVGSPANLALLSVADFEVTTGGDAYAGGEKLATESYAYPASKIYIDPNNASKLHIDI